jgi:hypothetical protein
MAWTRYAGWINAILGVVLLGVMAAIGMVGLGLILLVSLTGSGLFMVWLAQGWDKPLEDASELHRYGRPANAEVLSVVDAQLTGDGRRTAKVTLRVSPRNESRFKTTRVLELPGGRIPAVGDTVTVKFDPQKRRNVILLEENFEVVDSVQAARANIAALGGTTWPTAPGGPGAR